MTGTTNDAAHSNTTASRSITGVSGLYRKTGRITTRMNRANRRAFALIPLNVSITGSTAAPSRVTG
ncbi:hypothetical protein GCM10010171_21010 [Actinokineospora fastidiosa]|uniref:Uncharacterized protein n=1 Tax=Actinokineospora fastidiosa TaxID=1816 RepID=A0A918GC24_9PSEU|nr:hypothetical protein GCM10010171_21010 [Actinokineospora fastidiosa]